MPGVTTAYQTGVHGSRPAASAGCILYSCTTHGLVYRSDGTSWTTFLTLPSGSVSASPSLTLSTSASAGAASTFVATDATLPIFDATAPSTQAFSDAAAVGVAAFAARRDHKHGMPASGAGAATSEPFVTTAATGGLSAETVRPELADASAGTEVDMSGAATGTSVSAADAGDSLTKVTFVADSLQYWDVARALGTGDFDVRARIVSLVPVDVSGLSNNAYGGLSITDSSRTAGTRQIIAMSGPGPVSGPYVRPITNASFAGNALFINQFPIILRFARASSTLSFYVSVDEGHSWSKMLGIGSSTTDYAKVGLTASNNTGGNPQYIVDWIRQVS